MDASTTTLLLLKISLILGLALGLVPLLVRANPRWRMFLCEAAAAGVLLLPAALWLPDALTVVLPFGGGQAKATGTPLSHGGALPETGWDGGLSPGLAGLGAAAESADGTMPAPTPGESRRARLGLAPSLVLGTLWGLGVGALALGYAIGFLRLRRSTAALDPPDAQVRALFQRIADELGLTGVPDLRVTDLRTSPFCCAVGRGGGTVVIPESLTAPGQSTALGFVLRHELHHLANGDLRRAALLNLTTVLLWFHPLAWMLRRRHAAAAEELSDRVAAGGEAGRVRYRAVLAALTRDLQGVRPHPPLAIGIVRRPQIITRLRRLGSAVPHGPLGLGARLALTLTVGVPILLGLAALRLSGAEDGKADDAPATAAAARAPAGFLEALPDAARVKAEASMELAFRALRAAQAADGSLAPKSIRKGDAHVAGTSALAGMAFLAHGGAAASSPNHEPLLRCLDYVLG